MMVPLEVYSGRDLEIRQQKCDVQLKVIEERSVGEAVKVDSQDPTPCSKVIRGRVVGNWTSGLELEWCSKKVT